MPESGRINTLKEVGPKNGFLEVGERTTVFKLGGSLLDGAYRKGLLEELSALNRGRMPVVVVHGSGKEITNKAKKMGLAADFIDGRRVTDERLMALVREVMPVVGDFVSQQLSAYGGLVEHIVGSDGVLKVEQMEGFGYVGKVVEVNAQPILQVAMRRGIPVITPLGFRGEEEVFNINADSAAASIALSLKAKRLILVTDADGVVCNGLTMPELRVSEAERLIDTGVIRDGMLPKVEAAMAAAKAGMLVRIVNGNVPGIITQAVFGHPVPGTMVMK